MRDDLPGSSCRLRRGLRPVLALTAMALVAAGCGNSAGNTTGSSANSPDSALAAEVEKLSAPRDAYPIPTEPVGDVSKIAGTTVYYIPITQQAHQFAITAKALSEALATVGMTMQLCNGNSNPSEVSACVSQATAANAGAIVTDSIPYALAANGFDAAQAKGIPVLITDQIPDPKHPASTTLGYLEGGGTAMLTAMAKWIIHDSGGTAKVVVNQSTDSQSTVAYVEAARKVFDEDCPRCTVTVNKISSANYSLIASSTSSALLRTPGANYLVSEFDQYLQPTLSGAQQSGRTPSLKGASAGAQLPGLKMVESKNFLHADVGQASVFQGWADADAVLRLMTGKPLPDYEIPVRIFTRDTIGSVELTEEAEESGEWFGPTDFPTKFGNLWKAN
ncbi:sugar ABC transporter substrate-binding protein [Cryptosporangium minutisporangium]|uniref:Periplasmic binding protein domain-containing protein n=1 Tax=Cryptosporangium minutisporangium TaxID=113569 RepID=A0ABP6T4R5_9ACTN